MVGRYHPDYTVDGDKSKWGGTGSDTYELQRVGGIGGGVSFTRDRIWHYNADNQLVKEMPGDSGEHHYDVDREVNVVGPAPGSHAAGLLGNGRYIWNSTDELYEIE
jgi:hypothetical protein